MDKKIYIKDDKMTDLRHFYFFENLSDEQLTTINSFATRTKMLKGSILFYEKEQPKALTLLIDGTLKVYKTDLKNNEIVMHRFTPMAFVAEMAVLEGLPYPASAVFETDGEVIQIDFERFKNEFLNDPDIAFIFFKSLSKKMRYLESVIALNVVLDSTARLAKFIYDTDGEALVKYKHYQLAEHLHMTPETLSRVFKKLLKLNLLEKDVNSYKIKNKEGLQALFD
ncbi:Crp/Fnr family transcriptional regulator [Sulfurimonas sp. HSL-1716]|uniref:Crp/Fnr family transcriptional regulator n=1 Tax=Hydrocurvibacter sulfurireducens TaxID=3131937 RepID=UPI0031F949F7